MDFELIFPCYNEAQSLPTLVTEVLRTARAAQLTPAQFCLVLVDNGSSDNTAEVIAELMKQHGSWLRTEEIKVNRGYGHGLYQGLMTTTAQYVGWSHADLQCAPADAFTALSHLRASGKKTLVKGKRYSRDWKDKMVTNVFETLAKTIVGIRCNEINAQPKVFDRDLLKEIVNPPTHFGFDLYVLYRASRAGYQFKEIPVALPPRVFGTSHWASNFFSRYKTILGMIRYLCRLSLTEGRIPF